MSNRYIGPNRVLETKTKNKTTILVKMKPPYAKSFWKGMPFVEYRRRVTVIKHTQ